MSKCICSFHSACSVFIWFQMLRSDLREKKKKKNKKHKRKREKSKRREAMGCRMLRRASNTA